MDPRIHPEQPGWSNDSGPSDDGANYLRRLKGDLPKPAPVELSSEGFGKGSVTNSVESPEKSERRKSPRFRCSGSVELQLVGSDVRMWGTFTDISLHGCYVEMNNTFPSNIRVNLVLQSCGLRIQSEGTVRASHPALGMGICFTNIEPAQHAQLQRLLAKLSGQRTHPANESALDNLGLDNLTMSDPQTAAARAVLDEITEFFRGKQLLSRDEFQQIVKQTRRS